MQYVIIEPNKETLSLLRMTNLFVQDKTDQHYKTTYLLSVSDSRNIFRFYSTHIFVVATTKRVTITNRQFKQIFPFIMAGFTFEHSVQLAGVV